MTAVLREEAGLRVDRFGGKCEPPRSFDGTAWIWLSGSEIVGTGMRPCLGSDPIIRYACVETPPRRGT